MEKFFYFGDITSSDSALSYPVESWRGSHPEDDTTLHLYFTPINEQGLAPAKDNDVMVLTIGTNKHREVLTSIAESVGDEENFIVIADNDNSIYIDSNIVTWAGVIMSSDV